MLSLAVHITKYILLFFQPTELLYNHKVIFFINSLIYSLYILITAPSPPLLSPTLTKPSSNCHLPFCSWGDALGYHSTLRHLVPVGLHTSSPTETKSGRGKGSNRREQRPRQSLPPPHLLGVPYLLLC